jgi:hypothetical protein
MRDHSRVVRNRDHVDGVEIEQGEQHHARRGRKVSQGARREGMQAGHAQRDFGGDHGVQVAAERSGDVPDEKHGDHVIELPEPKREEKQHGHPDGRFGCASH